MKKFAVFIAVLLAVVLFAGSASAHSKMTASVPAENSVSENPVTEVVLEFNTKIEPVAQLTITNESGAEISVKDVQVSDARLTGLLSEPLYSGSYTVAWKVIGADGHSVNGSYSFSVNAPPPAEPEPAASEAAETPAPTAAQSGQPASTTAPSPAPAADTSVSGESNNDSGTSKMIIYLLGGVALLLIIYIIVYARIKKK